MKKTIYLSTAEGHYMFSVLEVVDYRTHRLLRAVALGKLAPEKYKNLVLGWEAFLNSHIDFLNELSQVYATDYTEKTRQKKSEIALQMMRKTGEKKEVYLLSYFGELLFKTVIHTEMCFKLVHEYAQSGDLSLDAMLDLTERFMKRRSLIEEYVGKLISLERRVSELPIPDRIASV